MAAAPTPEQAALNNALWCASVVRAAGGADHRAATLWWSAGPPPPLYPRAVTLARDLDAGDRARLEALAPGEAVKDSFACLELDGFETLFDATWFWRPPRPGAGVAAERVTTPAALAGWRRAWGEEQGEAILGPALLRDPAVLILGLRDGEGFAAGCVLNRGAGVMGLSNLFGRDAAARAAMIEAAARAAGELALVDYEADGAEEAVLAVGFQPLGRLRVLLRSEAP